MKVINLEYKCHYNFLVIPTTLWKDISGDICE